MTQENKYSIEWHIPEYAPHARTRRWYIIATTALLVLVISSLFTGNFLFALILIIVAMIIAVHDKNTPDDVLVVIDQHGVTIGAQTYLYAQFKSFWIYYEPSETKMLFFEFKSGIRPRLAIPLLNKNPLKIRTILLAFLTEDIQKENEPLSEQLSRLLKL